MSLHSYLYRAPDYDSDCLKSRGVQHNTRLIKTLADVVLKTTLLVSTAPETRVMRNLLQNFTPPFPSEVSQDLEQFIAGAIGDFGADIRTVVHTNGLFERFKERFADTEPR
jgi:hypothetical protein